MADHFLLKFWKIPSLKLRHPLTSLIHRHTHETKKESAPTVVVDDDLEEEDEDSYFELEITLPELGSVCSSETNPKPHSSISFLKWTPRFRVFMFKKSKCPAEKTDKHAETRGEQNQILHGSLKRLSIEGVQKYVNLVKPLYTKATMKNSTINATPQRNNIRPCKISPLYSTETLLPSSPAKRLLAVSRFRSNSKSRVSSSMKIHADDTLKLQHDGIESAILHCKRSYSSADDSLYSPRASAEAN